MMALGLDNGYCALVDEQDAVQLSWMRWHTRNKSGQLYAYARVPGTGDPGVIVGMHRFLMDAGQRKEVDHINGNGLDNRRSNLRLCNRQQNSFNRGAHRGHSSKYKGVSFRKGIARFRATISLNNRKIHLGHFVIEEDAARAYDKAALELHGEFARLNFPEAQR